MPSWVQIPPPACLLDLIIEKFNRISQDIQIVMKNLKVNEAKSLFFLNIEKFNSQTF
ncbi:MAG: hypothetical protein QW648_00385 [Nanoarchaeales archaeon]